MFTTSRLLLGTAIVGGPATTAHILWVMIKKIALGLQKLKTQLRNKNLQASLLDYHWLMNKALSWYIIVLITRLNWNIYD